MPENVANPGNPGDPESNGASTPDELATIKAQLEEEQGALAEAKALLTQSDIRIAELEASLSEAKKGSEALTTDKASLSDALTAAVHKYLALIRSANPTIPPDVLAGATIADIDASLTKAASIAAAVKTALEAQAKQASVPAGAPPRGAIGIESMSPREKIAAGLLQKQAPQ